MRRIQILPLTLIFVAASGMAVAQTSGGWRRVGDPPPAPSAPKAEAPLPAQPQLDPTEPVDRSDGWGQQQQDGLALQTTPQQATAAPARPAYGLPPSVTLRPGTFVTVRTNQELSSDRDHQGDPFSAVLVQPVVVDGVVVAQRGQMVYGRVAEAQKAHGGSDSRLALELTGLTLADGNQQPIRSQLVAHEGPRTPGAVQAGTVVGTTAVGAAVGGIIGWGTGAAIGAGAGAAAGLATVMMTRNHPTVLYPESVLTFEVTTPVTVSTLNAPQAFRFVGPEDYDRPYNGQQLATRPRPAPAAGYAYPYYGPAYYPYYGYSPYYYGPSVGIAIGVGRGWGYRGGYGGYRHYRR